MPSLADVVREHAPAYLARYGAAMPTRHMRALRAITECRTAALGAELAVCDHCSAQHLVFHSCRHRACPRCGHDATAAWIERQKKNLLPVPYFHVVFTLPNELRHFVRRHARILLRVLFRAAFESLATLAADPKYLGAQIGALAVLHTWTRTLEWHPHVHMLVPGGGLAPDGITWRTVQRPRHALFLVPVHALSKLFRGRFLHLARRALPGVQFPHIPWKKPWVVFAKPSLHAKPDTLLEYLGRYVHRTALTDKRVAASDERTVTFTYRDSRNGKRKAMTLDGEEFLRRFLQHVPLKGFHRVRAYGLLHPKHRVTLRRLRLLLDRPAPAPVDTVEPDTAVDSTLPLTRALRCPDCQVGTLRTVARLTPLQASTFAATAARASLARAPP